jgi:general stress protein 26
MRKNASPLRNKFKSYCFTFSVILIAVHLECISQEKPTSLTEREAAIAAAREIIGMQTYCALITVDSCGKPQIRTMNPFPPEDDMTVWIATNSRSRKVKEIQKNSNVCLYYSNHNQATGYVSIRGKAVLVDDMDEKLRRKRAYWTQAFPDWNYLMLIKVIPENIEVLNYKRNTSVDPITWSIPSIELKRP